MTSADTASSSSSFSSSDSFGRPELSEGALYGLAGDVVRAVEPHTEGDPAALLLSYLTLLGNACGPQASVIIGADHHPGRLYTLLVGDSATARKGTAGSETERIFDLAVPDWFADRVERGIQSAEAVIARAGETRDPRLLLAEPEFGRLLATMARRPNLPGTLKAAWDGQPLSTVTKDLADRRTARGAHISIIAHVSAVELADRLSTVDVASGFANRFLYASVGRSKLLPRGGSLPVDVLEKLADETREVVEFAHELALRHLDPVSRELCAFHSVFPPVELKRTGAYFALWDELYVGPDGRGGELLRHPAGVPGIVTSRAEVAGDPPGGGICAGRPVRGGGPAAPACGHGGLAVLPGVRHRHLRHIHREPGRRPRAPRAAQRRADPQGNPVLFSRNKSAAQLDSHHGRRHGDRPGGHCHPGHRKARDHHLHPEVTKEKTMDIGPEHDPIVVPAPARQPVREPIPEPAPAEPVPAAPEKVPA